MHRQSMQSDPFIYPPYVNTINTTTYSLAQGRTGAVKTTASTAKAPVVARGSSLSGAGPAWRTDNNSSINTYGHRGEGSMMFRFEESGIVGIVGIGIVGIEARFVCWDCWERVVGIASHDSA